MLLRDWRYNQGGVEVYERCAQGSKLGIPPSHFEALHTSVRSHSYQEVVAYAGIDSVSNVTAAAFQILACVRDEDRRAWIFI